MSLCYGETCNSYFLLCVVSCCFLRLMRKYDRQEVEYIF